MAATKSKEPKTMEELLQMTGTSLKSFRKGERVDAKLTRVGKRAAYFDIGGKSEGVVSEANFSEVKSFVNTLKTGDTVKALVLEPENVEGLTVLSLRHSAQRKFWEDIEKAYKSDEILHATGKSITSHGLMVTIGGYSAFIPNSQIGQKASEEIEDLVDSQIDVKVIDMDQKKGRIVLSERAVSEADIIQKNQRALDAVQKGKLYEGVVTAVVSFGIFVEIEVKTEKKEEIKLEGLVHVSELSWSKIDDPSTVYSEGDEVKVKVLGVDKGKVAMSIKQAKEDPWTELGDKYDAETKVEGKIVRISDFGVFVELEPGVEGLIHMTKIPPGTSLKDGEKVNCYVEDINKEERRISLGLVLTTAKPVGYR